MTPRDKQNPVCGARHAIFIARCGREARHGGPHMQRTGNTTLTWPASPPRTDPKS